MKLNEIRIIKLYLSQNIYGILIVIISIYSSLMLSSSVLAKSCPVKISKPNACDSLKYRPENFCKGREFVPDAYNYNKLIPCDKNMHIDHVISWSWVHKNGLVCDKNLLDKICSDPRNYVFTTKETNLKKSDKSPVAFARQQLKEGKWSKSETAKQLQNYINISKNLNIKFNMNEISSVLSNNKNEALKLLENAKIPAEKLRQSIRTIYDKQIALKNIKDMNQKIIKDIFNRMRNRIATALARNTAISAAQSSTVILAPVALATIAWEVNDACTLLEDLGELESITETKTGVSQENQVDDKICNMSYDDLFEMITGKSLKFDECVKARLILKEVQPEECLNFEIEEVLVDAADIKKEVNIEVPDVD